jgi:hypothetical protein
MQRKTLLEEGAELVEVEKLPYRQDGPVTVRILDNTSKPSFNPSGDFSRQPPPDNVATHLRDVGTYLRDVGTYLRDGALCMPVRAVPGGLLRVLICWKGVCFPLDLDL